MKKWEIKYICQNAGANNTLTWNLEASEKNQAESLFKEIYPLEKIISINQINK
jgi:hypothetical protein